MSKKKATLEEQISKLEQICQQLDKSELPIEDLLKLYEEGLEVSNAIKIQIENAEQRIVEIQGKFES